MKIYERLIQRADDRYEALLRRQILDPQSLFYGGVRQVRDDIVEYNPGCEILSEGCMLYFCPTSRFYRSEIVQERMEAALQFAFQNLNPDGTKHYLDCNFYTAAGTETQSIGEAVILLDRVGDDVFSKRFRPRMMELLERLAHGVMCAGFHTPNHRWIYSGALAVVYRITGKQEYLDAIEGFLKEGIDCNPDGEYAERSAGIYNLVTNRGLILMGEYLDRPEFYDYVRRNLELMFSYLEPDGSLFTMNSTRQDYGEKMWAEKYTDNYLFLGKVLKIEEYTRMGLHLYYQGISHGGRDLENSLAMMFALHPEFQTLEEPDRDLYSPAGRRSFFRESGIVRCVSPGMSLSLLKESPTFFYGQFGTVSLCMRIYCHFFSARNAVFREIQETKDGYRMTYEAKGLYLLPLKEKPEKSDWWWQKQNCKRETKEPAHLLLQIEAVPEENGITFRLHTETCDRVPLRIEVGVSSDCLVSGTGFRCPTQKGMKLMATEGIVRMETETDTVGLGPVFGEHAKLNARSGAADPGASEMTLCLNTYCHTEDRVFYIRRTVFPENL